MIGPVAYIDISSAYWINLMLGGGDRHLAKIKVKEYW